jgi:malonate transporter
MHIMSLILPVFAVIITGWLFGLLKIFPQNIADALIQFSFYVAVPALLFITLAQEPVAKLANGDYILAYGGTALLFFIATALFSKVILNKSLAKSTIMAMCSSMSNASFVGLPLLVALFGNAAVVPAVISVAFVMLIIFPLAMILLEISANEATLDATFIIHLVRQVLYNPMIIALVLGIVVSVSGMKLHAGVVSYFNILGAALTPCALFAIGLGIKTSSLRTNFLEIMVANFIKLLILPFVTLLICRYLSMAPLYAVSAIIINSVPTAKSVYVLAGKYNTEQEIAASIIYTGTLISMASLLLWVFIISHYWPGLVLLTN